MHGLARFPDALNVEQILASSDTNSHVTTEALIQHVDKIVSTVNPAVLLVVREYGAVNYLSMCEDAEIHQIDDIGKVMNEEDEEGRNAIEGEIILVQIIGGHPPRTEA